MSDIPVLTQSEGSEDFLTQVVSDVNEVLTTLNTQNSFLQDIKKTINSIHEEREETSKDSGVGFFDKISQSVFSAKGVFGSKLTQISEYLSPKKLSPKKNVMMKHSPESVYLAETITGKIDETQEEDGGGFLSNLFSGGGIMSMLGMGKIAGPIGKILTKAAPIAAIAGGLIWMAVDGIKGFFKAEEWDVSKIGGTIGGILGGTGEGGLKDAFKNMGKWALIGAGVGTMIAPIVGTLIGGLLGAAVGGILGFIGGKNIAKGIDKIGSWFKDVWNSEFIEGIRSYLVDLPSKLIEGVGNFINVIQQEFATFKEDPGAWASEKWNAITGKVGEFFGAILTKVQGGYEAAQGWVQDRMINPVYNFFGRIKTTVEEKLEDIGNWIGDYIVDPLKTFFGIIGDFFGKVGEFFSDPIGFVSRRLSGENMEESADQMNESLGAFNVLSGQDMVIKPSGEMYRTAPGDTLIATRSPVKAFKDNEVEESMRVTNQYMNDAFNDQVLNALNQIASILSNQQPQQNNVLQQNFANRYKPQAIMDKLAVQVE